MSSSKVHSISPTLNGEPESEKVRRCPVTHMTLRAKSEAPKEQSAGAYNYHELSNMKFSETPQIFKDCFKILLLCRWTRLHPISYEKSRELRGICPLTFSWRSSESIIAYFQFLFLVALGIASVRTIVLH